MANGTHEQCIRQSAKLTDGSDLRRNISHRPMHETSTGTPSHWNSSDRYCPLSGHGDCGAWGGRCQTPAQMYKLMSDTSSKRQAVEPIPVAQCPSCLITPVRQSISVTVAPSSHFPYAVVSSVSPLPIPHMAKCWLCHGHNSQGTSFTIRHSLGGIERSH